MRNLCDNIFYMETNIFQDFHVCFIYLNFSLIVLHISPNLAIVLGCVFKLRFLISPENYLLKMLHLSVYLEWFHTIFI